MKSHHPAPWAIYTSREQERIYVVDNDGDEVGLEVSHHDINGVPDWMERAVDGVNDYHEQKMMEALRHDLRTNSPLCQAIHTRAVNRRA